MRIRTRLFCIYTMLIMMSAGCNGQFLPGFAAQSTPAINPTPGPSITPVPTLLSIPATPTNPAPTNLPEALLAAICSKSDWQHSLNKIPA
jgi:hypothetical protein